MIETLDFNDQPNAKKFFDAVSSFSSVMIPSFSFIAFKKDDRWEIFRARLSLNLPGNAPDRIFVQTSNIMAGVKVLSDSKISPRKCVRDILNGEIEFEGTLLSFPARDGSYASTFTPLHAEGIEHQNRVTFLQIIGNDQTGYHSYAPFDWELKAAPEPYQHIIELLATLGLSSPSQPSSTFEALAYNIVAIDGSSKVNEAKATFRLRIVKGLDKKISSIGYRVLSNNVVVSRSTIPGTALKWSDDDDTHVGEAYIDVPSAAVIHAIARYDGVAYQHWWFADINHSQNPRRASFEVADPNLQILASFFENRSMKHARDLEFATSWLLWILGFSVAHLGANQRMSDAADLIVTTPEGHFAVVECTTGQLKAEHKLSLLVERATIVKDRLEKSNSPHLRVLPIIFTTKTREEVRTDLDHAKSLGVVVIGQDDIPALMQRTLLLPNADQYYREAEQSLQDG